MDGLSSSSILALGPVPSSRRRRSSVSIRSRRRLPYGGIGIRRGGGVPRSLHRRLRAEEPHNNGGARYEGGEADDVNHGVSFSFAVTTHLITVIHAGGCIRYRRCSVGRLL